MFLRHFTKIFLNFPSIFFKFLSFLLVSLLSLKGNKFLTLTILKLSMIYSYLFSSKFSKFFACKLNFWNHQNFLALVKQRISHFSVRFIWKFPFLSLSIFQASFTVKVFSLRWNKIQVFNYSGKINLEHKPLNEMEKLAGKVSDFSSFPRSKK